MKIFLLILFSASFIYGSADPCPTARGPANTPIRLPAHSHYRASSETTLGVLALLKEAADKAAEEQQLVAVAQGQRCRKITLCILVSALFIAGMIVGGVFICKKYNC